MLCMEIGHSLAWMNLDAKWMYFIMENMVSLSLTNGGNKINIPNSKFLAGKIKIKLKLTLKKKNVHCLGEILIDAMAF